MCRRWIRHFSRREEMMNAKLRVLVADDHEQCGWAMAHLLSVECEVIASVADGRKLVDVDISMPWLSGMEAMEELHRKGYQIPFVLVSTNNCGSEDYIKRGAMAFVNKVDIGHDLMVAVFSAALGQVCVSRSAEERRFNTLRCA